MSEPTNEYALIGFEWELLALVIGMWAKEKYGIDLQEEVAQGGLKTVNDDNFWRLVARRFRQHWIKPKVPDRDRQERVAGLLVKVDEMVDELIKESNEFQGEFQRRCAEAGCCREGPKNRRITSLGCWLSPATSTRPLHALSFQDFLTLAGQDARPAPQTIKNQCQGTRA